LIVATTAKAAADALVISTSQAALAAAGTSGEAAANVAKAAAIADQVIKDAAFNTKTTEKATAITNWETATTNVKAADTARKTAYDEAAAANLKEALTI